ncbi:MAG: hypothetical protein RI894_1123, partial [Bacteroidota bacterium]
MKGELEGRWDPLFYDSKYRDNVEKIKKYGSTKLGDLILISSETWDGKAYFNTHFPYIEISELDIPSGEIKNINLILKENAPSRAKMIVRNDDILVSTTRPNRGAIALLKEDKIQVASTGFAVLRHLKRGDILKPFLYLMLRQNFILQQMEQRSSGGNYPAITAEELKQIQIPLPPLATQQHIVEKMEAAYAAKKAKEAEAAEMLGSIDAYLLSALGITLPETAKKQTTFFICSEMVSGGRFDPFYYLHQAYKIEGGIYHNKTLKAIAFLDKGQSITKDNITAGEYPVIAGGQNSPYT